MKPSSLQLKRYFITELKITANRAYDPSASVDLTHDDLTVTPSFFAEKHKGLSWQVTLRIMYQPKMTVNTPYLFTLELVGFFVVLPGYPTDKAEKLVRTNATSVLYSTAREVLRGTMAQGPYSSILLPSVSFYDPEAMKQTLSEGTEG